MIFLFIWLFQQIEQNALQQKKVCLMAFVSNQPRWPKSIILQTPGPGSHSPDILQTPPIKEKQKRQKIFKGKAYHSNTKLEQSQIRAEQSKIIAGQIKGQSRRKPKMDSYKKMKFEDCIKEKKRENFDTNCLTISSLQAGVIFNVQRAQQLRQIMQQSTLPKNNEDISKSIEGETENIEIKIKRTEPSIKHIYRQKFYIGSKQDPKKKEGKKGWNEKDIRLRRKSAPCVKRKFQHYVTQNSLNHDEIEDEYIIQKQRKKVPKRISSNHPFHRNQQLYSIKLDHEQNETGIQQDQLSEYISDAVPGPGYYNLLNTEKTTKKSKMFTEMNLERFSNLTNKVGYQFLFPSELCWKKSSKGSKAKQSRVGFGKCVQKQSATKGRQPQPQYSGFQDLQSRCMKLKLKDSLNPGFFSSKAPRFRYKTSEKNADHFYIFDQKIQEIQKEQKNKMAPFLTSCLRSRKQNRLTSDIDFAAQQYMTIKAKIQQREKDWRFFVTQDQRGDIENQQKKPSGLDRNCHFRSEIEIKHRLVEQMYGFRNRKNEVQEPKGYTFRKNENQVEVEGNNLMVDPTKYHKEQKWVKSSFNIKYPNSYKKHNLKKNSKSFRMLNFQLNKNKLSKSTKQNLSKLNVPHESKDSGLHKVKSKQFLLESIRI